MGARLIRTATPTGVVFSGTLLSAGQTTREQRTSLRTDRLGDDQIAMIDRGKAVRFRLIPFHNSRRGESCAVGFGIPSDTASPFEPVLTASVDS